MRATTIVLRPIIRNADFAISRDIFIMHSINFKFNKIYASSRLHLMLYARYAYSIIHSIYVYIIIIGCWIRKNFIVHSVNDCRYFFTKLILIALIINYTGRSSSRKSARLGIYIYLYTLSKM